MSSQDRFYDLMGRKLSEEATQEELWELEHILQGDAELQFLHDQLLKPAPPEASIDTEAAYLPHYLKMIHNPAAAALPSVVPVKTRTAGFKKVLAFCSIAALLILVLGLGGYLFKGKNTTLPPAALTAATPRGSKSTLSLPDGTIVHLNTNSYLSYKPGFGQTTREVTLVGEGYFEVAHNAKVPFIVHTSEADIKVLGTEFNVRNYNNEDKMETSLLKGSIEMTLVKTKRTIRMEPSEKVIIERPVNTSKTAPSATKDIRITNISVADSEIVETSWLHNKMAFKDKPLSEIAVEFERRFEVTISFANNQVAGYHYTGVFDETNLEDILRILQMIKPFHYRLEKNTVLIY